LILEGEEALEADLSGMVIEVRAVTYDGEELAFL